MEQAKKLYPHTHLLVGCCSDAVTHKYKGITVMSEDERYESLRHCKCVACVRTFQMDGWRWDRAGPLKKDPHTD